MGTTKEYLQKLYSQSRGETANDLGTKGAFVILVLKIAGVSIGVALLVALGLLKTQDSVYKVVFAIFLSDISGLTVLYILLPMISVFKMPKIAAQNDKRQKERLEEIDPELSELVVTEFNSLPWEKYVGIDVRNLSSEEFDGVMELVEFASFELDEHCDEQLHSTGMLDRGNNHVHLPKIKGNDRTVIKLAELRDDINLDGKQHNGLILLTEKPTTVLVTEFVFFAPQGQKEPDYKKMYFYLDFEIRGRLKDKMIRRKYSGVITLRARVLNRKPALQKPSTLGTREIDSQLEIGEIEHQYKKPNKQKDIR